MLRSSAIDFCGFPRSCGPSRLSTRTKIPTVEEGIFLSTPSQGCVPCRLPNGGPSERGGLVLQSPFDVHVSPHEGCGAHVSQCFLPSACLFREMSLEVFCHFPLGFGVLLGCWLVSAVELLIGRPQADLGSGARKKVPEGLHGRWSNGDPLVSSCVNPWAVSRLRSPETPSLSLPWSLFRSLNTAGPEIGPKAGRLIAKKGGVPKSPPNPLGNRAVFVPVAGVLTSAAGKTSTCRQLRPAAVGSIH